MISRKNIPIHLKTPLRHLSASRQRLPADSGSQRSTAQCSLDMALKIG
ncbi:MAG: hypothetical protein O7G88_04470 [bacterium]|nr:hypothetical protein [bacterium]